MSWKGYRITSPFGWRTHPIRGGREFHTGIDLAKLHLANIEAFTDGQVLYAGPGRTGTGLGGYGNVVLVGDKNNRGQLYAHLHNVSVKTGQSVIKGQVIGRQGATGQVTGSHLHFEVRKTAEKQAPFGWIADRANNCLEPIDYIDNFKHDDKTKGVTYVVKRGDTLSKIADQHGATVDELVKINNIKNANLIHPGQELVINKKATLKPVEEVAQEIADGKGNWGNNPQRRKKLEDAGYDYLEVQNLVNKIVAERNKPKLKPFDVIVQEVIDLKWGVNPERKKRLIEEGYDYQKIQQEVNRRARK